MSVSTQSGASLEGSPAEKPLTPQRIMQYAWGFAPTVILESAVRHRFFDVLDSGAKTAAQVAEATGTAPRAVRAILDALVGLELLTRDHGQRYALTAEAAAFLVSTKPSFHGGLLKHMTGQLLHAWLQLPEVAKTGAPIEQVNQQQTGAAFFEQFVEDLFPMNYPAARGLADALAAAGTPSGDGPVEVLDLAAGSGVWGIALAQRFARARVTAVDWPSVTKVTQRVAQRMGVGDRLTTLAGDLLEVSYGRGYHVATLGHILHSEGEPRSRRLLAKVIDALAPGGTIAIAEFIPNDDRTGPPMPLIFGVNMLVHTREGDVFTFPQLAGWLREAGFTDVRTLPAPAPSPLILATKPGSTE